jgi:hypothetical protein
LNEKRHLLIVDKVPFTLPQGQVDARWDILGLGRTQEELEQFLSSYAKDRDDLHVLDPCPWAEEAERWVREFVVPLLDELPERKLQDGQPLGALLSQANGLNDWWLLPISEKSPLRSWIQDLYSLAMIHRACRYGNYALVGLGISDRLFRHVVAGGLSVPTYGKGGLSFPIPAPCLEWLYYICAIRAWVRHVGLQVLARHAGWPDVPPPEGPAIFTVFPAWWSEADSRDAKDRFYPSQAGDVPGGIGGGQGYWVWWSGGLRKTWRFRQVWKDLIRKKQFTLLSRHIPARAWWYLFSPIRFFRLCRFRKTVGKLSWPRFQGFDIGPLLQREISRSIGSGAVVTGRLLAETLRGCAFRWSLTELWFRFEGQPIDRALISAIRGISRSVGFWHSAFAAGPNYLPIVLKQGCLAETAQAAEAFSPPFPDTMMTIGSIGQKTLQEAGLPPDRIRICGPLRSGQMIQSLRQTRFGQNQGVEPGTATRRPVLFLAGSVAPIENRGLVHALLRSLASLPPVELVLRPHPACPFPEDFGDLLRSHPGVVGFSVASDQEVYRQLASADVLVSGGSSIVFDAMALGVMPLVYECPGEFSACSMQNFESAIFRARNSEEMIRNLKAIFGRTKAWSDRRARWPRVCQAVFGDLWPEGKGGGLDGAKNPGPS